MTLTGNTVAITGAAPSPALAGEGWGEGRGNYDAPHPAPQPSKTGFYQRAMAPPSPASGRR